MRWHLAAALTLAGTAIASPQAPARTARAIQVSQWVRLRGNRLPQARPANDRGAAPGGLPMRDMLLVLRRSPKQEAALRQELAALRERDSPQYHRWLTPQEFGARYGPARSELAAVTAWLARSGFRVDEVSASRGVIEFSGTAGQVEAAMHTAIHRYRIAGALHWANSQDPAIPAALAPVVAGVVSLNDVRAPSAGRILGEGRAMRAQPGRPIPSLTVNSGGQVLHVMAPGDLAKIYDFDPLYAKGLDGSGESVAVVGRSSVSMQDVSTFRQLFLPAADAGNLPQTIVVGAAPGDQPNLDQGEATLDVEWAGAVAPKATIYLVVSGGSLATDGVDLAALYAVDHDVAPVINTSFGLCEADEGAAGNRFWNDLWEQAAAEGITALVAAGDNGAAGCDDPASAAATDGLAVSGIASTPYDTAVGGTEFSEGGADQSYWDTQSFTTSNYTSALGHIPEQPWDESLLEGPQGSGIWSGSGGASQIYAKPSWQSGTGVPQDQHRDVPDVALTAAAHDGYVVCWQASCQGSPYSFSFFEYSGTSASSPSWAGLMAIVNQATGSPQGLVNPKLYQLAAQESVASCNASAQPASNCVLLDVTSGNNRVPCVANSPDCTAGSLGFDATAGYDLATGLGSVDGANLVAAWNSVRYAATTTVLTLNPPPNPVHGQSVPFQIQVSAGSGTPTGNVELLAESSSGIAAVQVFALDATGSVNASTTLLPGGTYKVVARYAGDDDFGSSESNAVPVTIAPEAATVTLSMYTVSTAGLQTPVSSVVYGVPFYVEAHVAGASGQGVPSGTVSLEDFFGKNGAVILANGMSLDSSGNGPSFSNLLVQGGVNSLVASYSGDASFQPANSAALPLTVAKAPTSIAITNEQGGQLAVVIKYTSYGVAPSAEFTVYDGSTALGTGGGGDIFAGEILSGFNLPPLVGATASLTASFPGDAYYLPSTSPPFTFTTPANVVFQPAALTFPETAMGTASAPLMATATNEGGTQALISPSIEGTPGFAETNTCGKVLAPGASCQVTVTYTPSQPGTVGGTLLLAGQFGLGLAGDSAGFRMLPSGGPLSVTAGQSVSTVLDFYPMSGFTGPVTLGCSGLPPMAQCAFSPAAPVLDGANPIPVTLTVATVAAAGVGAPAGGDGKYWLFLECMALGLPVSAWAVSRRGRRRLPAIALALLVGGAVACGGGGGGGAGGAGSVGNPPYTPGGGSTTPGPGAIVEPASLSLGMQAPGAASKPQAVTVYDSGAAALQISSIAATTTSGASHDFAETNTCGATVPSQTACSISVTFTPSQAGPESGALIISDNAPGSPQNVPLSGTGVTYTPSGAYVFTVHASDGGETLIVPISLQVQ